MKAKPEGYKGLSGVYIRGVEEALQKYGFHEDAIRDIVRAVNNYETLLHAVSLAKAYMMDETEETEDNVLDCLGNAIAKAEEK